MKRKTFTLIELLVVMGIISLVVTFAIPAMTGILGGSQLSQASDLVAGQLKYASQTALSQNTPVEVRFYKYKDPGMPGSSNAIRAMQLWQVNMDTTRTPAGRMQRFPGTIILSETTSAIGQRLTSLGLPLSSGSLPSKEITPSLPAGYTYNSFIFRPDGSTTLSATGQWYVTVVNENTQGNPPRNYATIQIEPVTGAIRLFRP